MKERRLAREIAVQSLYEMVQADTPLHRALGSNVKRRAASESSEQYASRILQALQEQEERVEGEIRRALQNWSWERVSLVERCVLRMGTVELLDFQDVPVQVIIDEAIEIARKFAGPDSGAFVNGVLDRIAKTCDRGCDRRGDATPDNVPPGNGGGENE